MPSKSRPLFVQERRLLAGFGERLRLARKRRHLSTAAIAERAGVSRTTVYKAEGGDGAVTFATYLRILVALGLQKDVELLAADDQLGRRLQDLELDPPRADPASTR